MTAHLDSFPIWDLQKEKSRHETRLTFTMAPSLVDVGWKDSWRGHELRQAENSFTDGGGSDST